MKILIIEDSEVYNKLLCSNIENNLLFAECKGISSFEELKKIKEDFDLYIVDFILQDAQGEQIKYLLERKKNIIVLTQYEEEFLKHDYAKKVIDYIIKDDYHTVNYLIKLLKNLHKNKNRKVLIVDDSMTVRIVQKQILCKIMLNIDEANNGKEAIEKINENKYDLIVTDIDMPIMNGEKLIKKIREKYSIDELPILVVSGNNDNSLIKCLKLGANDFIKKPFSGEELKVRVNNIFELYEHIKKILKSSQLDKLTGVYNRNFLENNFEEIFNLYEHKSIAMLDIDHFKKINDTYGHQIGDEILKYFASIIKNNIRKTDMVIRYGGEEFIVFLPDSYKEEALIVLHKIKKLLKPCKDINFTFSAGVADEGETLAEMIKLADERLYRAKKEGRNRIVSK
jgi:diguanylate cyclase (GGDEF)-like protein